MPERYLGAIILFLGLILNPIYLFQIKCMVSSSYEIGIIIDEVKLQCYSNFVVFQQHLAATYLFFCSGIFFW